MKTNPDDSAFPYSGLTKREYFASMMMQALCTATSNGTMGPRDDIYNAIRAIQISDALIDKLNTGKI